MQGVTASAGLVAGRDGAGDGGAIGEYQYTVDGTVAQTGASKTLSRRSTPSAPTP